MAMFNWYLMMILVVKVNMSIREGTVVREKGMVVLQAQTGVTTMFKVKLCEGILDCSKWNNNDFLTRAKYLCNRDCTSWSNVWWSTDVNGWETSGAVILEKDKSRQQRIKIAHFQGTEVITITIVSPQESDSGVYGIGVSLPIGTDPLGTFQLKVQSLKNATSKADFAFTEEQLLLETGFVHHNEWLSWVRYSTREAHRENCVSCAEGKQQLATVPLMQAEGNLTCLLKLFFNKTEDKCKDETQHFPVISKVEKPPTAISYPGSYMCISRDGTGKNYGNMGQNYCNVTVNGNENPFLENQTHSLADVWWLCGDNKLRSRLTIPWKGTCALAKLILPFYIFPVPASNFIREREIKPRWLNKRKREAPKQSFDSSVYIDSIGVPRGVPDEYKAINQIAAGFASIFVWIQPNKNVDWINYIYYNQQRFVNYTKDALKGIAEQLEATSQVAWQNRIALDMLLAKEGGVCKMFGTFCCMYIPNNTAPDGSITRSLKGLEMLSEELAENSGVNNPFTDFLQAWFGKWSHLISSFLVSVGVAVAIAVVCGCCCIPCIRGLLQRLVDAAVTKTMYKQLQQTGESEYIEM